MLQKVLLAFLVGIQVSLAGEPLIITSDTKLDPTQHYDAIEIRGSNLTIDGNGVTILGDMKSATNARKGIGIRADNVSNVTLKNVVVQGFEIGIHFSNCKDCTIEGCDLSDNYHDPEFGWGEQAHRGGILLDRCETTTVRECRANRVWNGCVLQRAYRCEIRKNDFSRCSNTCLSLWGTSYSLIADNNLSYGLRIKEGEVHARDSTGVLLEGGCNHNSFLRNDCTHGGDGIFIRSLSGTLSRHNYFESNDCSYANNNGFECWCPSNRFVGNKANHCSYGFWMGGSDDTRMIGNEACENGQETGFHNSPHLPQQGHAGIVFMFGSSAHVTLIGNVCLKNNGAGIALIGDEASKGKRFRPFHGLIEGNWISDCRWGIYLQFADWMVIADNNIPRCSAAIFDAGDNAHITASNNRDVRERPEFEVPQPIAISGPSRARVGESITLIAELGPHSDSSSEVEWMFARQDGFAKRSSPIALPKQAGYYELSARTLEPGKARIGLLGIYVLDALDQPELGTRVREWSEEPTEGKTTIQLDNERKLVGKNSLRVSLDPYSGTRVRVRYTPKSSTLHTEGKNPRLYFWMQHNNMNCPGFQDKNPEIVVTDVAGKQLRLLPKTEILNQSADEIGRGEWIYVSVPLNGAEGWTASGEPFASLKEIAHVMIGVDTWGSGPFDLWIDGMGFER